MLFKTKSKICHGHGQVLPRTHLICILMILATQIAYRNTYKLQHIINAVESTTQMDRPTPEMENKVAQHL